jgi:MFS family permease
VIDLDPRTARWRFLVLTALRWLPVGLVIPVVVLLPLSRGLTLVEIGLVFAVQGVVVLILELPTGGLADSIGRRPVLLVASVIGVVELALLAVADSFEQFVVVVILMGIYRALDSGPLEAWFVDTTLAADPDHQMEGGLSAAGMVLGLAIAVGALGSGALIAVAPSLTDLEPLVIPVLAAIVLGAIDLVAIALLMTEDRRPRGPRALAASVRAVPRVVGDGIGMLRSSNVLLTIVAVELFWGFSLVAFETLFPIRLSEIVGDADQAAVLLGPVSSVAWFASAAGAAGVVVVSRRIGVAGAAAVLRIAQGAAVVAMGILAGPIGVIAAFLGGFVAHGASNPMHMTLLHREADGPRRATVLSINSMVAQPAGAVGAIVLTFIAQGASVSTAMVVAGLVCAAAAPFYLPARAAERRRSAAALPGEAAPG